VSAKSKQPHERERQSGSDAVTVAAVAIIVYALCTFLHEGVGHGGACLLAGGGPKILSSMHFDGDTQGLPDWAPRLIAAGGPLVNLIAAWLAFGALRRLRGGEPVLRYALWLFAAVNLFLGTGYFLFSGVAGIGDWSAVFRGLSPAWLWRVPLALIGGAAYWLSVRLALRRLAPFYTGRTPAERVARANRLMLIPYFSGALLDCVAGAFSPAGIGLILISAAPATLGGTSGLAWGAQLLWGEAIPLGSEDPLTIPRSWGWILSAGVVALLFISFLGPGIRF
jgi:hypothetical protein